MNTSAASGFNPVNPTPSMLEGNRSELYQNGCGTNGLSLVFYYTDYFHPLTVCGIGTTLATYQM